MPRAVAISDFHSGHLVGLTPPKLDIKHNSDRYTLIDSARRTYWNFFAKTIDALKPIDVVIFVGDAIDGRGEKSGGTELIEVDRDKQCDMAVGCLEYIHAKENYMVYGTGYHTGELEDWEDKVAAGIGANKIGSHDWLDIDGVVFDYKHFIASSSNPAGRHGALAKEHLWAQLWAEHDEYPLGNVFLRGHVHYYDFCGGPDWMGMTLPALQGAGSKFGKRKCSGVVNFGLVSFEISKGEYTWQPHILKLKKSKQSLTKALTSLSKKSSRR